MSDCIICREAVVGQPIAHQHCIMRVARNDDHGWEITEADWLQRVLEVTKQRDELAAALQGVLHTCTAETRQVKRARAALREVR